MRTVDADPHPLDPLTQGLAHFSAPEPDHEQAVYWFRTAADAGNTEGLAMLAVCQLEGFGLPRDPEQARQRLEQASSAGSATAQFHLGRLLLSDWGSVAEAQRGLALYMAAAGQGHGDAAFHLASCLEAGWGCQPDHLAAKALFLRARALGSTLKATGLRIGQHELDAVRALARRLAQGPRLAQVLQERQHEIELVKELVNHPRRKARPKRRPRPQSRSLAMLKAQAAGLGTALAVLFCGRRSPSRDAGPTSVA
jgi:TPR repeat protein